MRVISLKNITKKYGDNVIFEKFNLEVEQGDFIAIMGPSGKGKSTLLNIIGILEEFDSGSLEIYDVKEPKFYTKAGIKLLREKISYLFQNFGLVEDKTVEYNMNIATRFINLSKQEIEKKQEEVVKNLGLEGYEKKKIYQLSGGEQQRIALARILLKPSEIILADEPTGSLDEGNKNIVMNMLSDLNKAGKTIIIVTHDMEVAKCCSKIINI